MNWLSSKIEAAMHEEDKGNLSPFNAFLYLFSFVYGSVSRLRSFCFEKQWIKSKKLPCVVISIGNIVSGGTGKTPLTVYVAKRLQAFGYRVAILSRGYKGAAERSGGIVSDGRAIRMNPDQSGDEPFMMAYTLKDIPVIVGRDRYASGMLAIERFQVDVIILDDGFQYLKLDRDLNLLLLDYHRPFGNGCMLPRGTLREPPSALERGDAILLTRADPDSKDPSGEAHAKALVSLSATGKPLYKLYYTPRIHKTIASRKSTEPSNDTSFAIDHIGDVKGLRCFAFSGIARNDDFKSTVEATGCNLTGFDQFRDHHAYQESDLNDIVQKCRELDVDIIMTTEKDAVRLPDTFHWPVPVVVIGLDVMFVNGNEAFNTYLKDWVIKTAGNRSIR